MLTEGFICGAPRVHATLEDLMAQLARDGYVQPVVRIAPGRVRIGETVRDASDLTIHEVHCVEGPPDEARSEVVAAVLWRDDAGAERRGCLVVPDEEHAEELLHRMPQAVEPEGPATAPEEG